MNDFNMAIYWYERKLTLREYADVSRAFITLLNNIHPVFEFLEWVGDRPNNAVKLEADTGNLDALIYAHAEYEDSIYEKRNPDRTLSWESFGAAGFGMGYSTGKSVSGGKVVIRIHAGQTGSRHPNVVAIEFPSHEDADFPYKEFVDHAFLSRLLLQLVAFWKPEDGRLTNYPFGEAVASSGGDFVGWLTYVRDPRAAALRNSPDLKNLLFQATPEGGTLISLGRAPISPDNAAQVEQARRLRQILIDERLVRS